MNQQKNEKINFNMWRSAELPAGVTSSSEQFVESVYW